MSSLSPSSCNVGVAIIHNKLKDSVIAKLLSQRHIKFRTSERLLEETVIFPKAKLAFLLVDITKPTRLHGSIKASDSSAVSQRGDSDIRLTDIKTRIDKFIVTHGQCVVVLKAKLFTSAEFRVLSQLQSIYLQCSVDLLPAHSAEDCIDVMLTLTSVQIPPACEVLCERMCDLMNSLLEPPQFLSTLKMN